MKNKANFNVLPVSVTFIIYLLLTTTLEASTPRLKSELLDEAAATKVSATSWILGTALALLNFNNASTTTDPLLSDTFVSISKTFKPFRMFNFMIKDY